MKKESMIIIVLSLLFLISCANTSYEERINAVNLKEGEYYSTINTENGLSIRDNKIAFFEKMTFNSDDIYEYIIVDSICIENGSEMKIGTYFKMFDFQDTSYIKIEKLLDSTIIINRSSMVDTFKFKGRTIFKEK